MPGVGPFRNVVDPAEAVAYRAAGWWSDDALVDHVRRHAADRPDKAAYVADDGTLTWRQLDEVSDRLARVLCTLGLEPGDRVAALLPDGATVHAAFLALEKAGFVLVGLGARAGTREIAHLLAITGATTLVTATQMRDRSVADLISELDEFDTHLDHLVEVPCLEADPSASILVDGTPVSDGPPVDLDERRIRPDDLFMINSTSGTTGMPKCVLHTQNRWIYFHRLAAVNGELTGDDVFMGAVPAPFGFGLWTAHFSPIILGNTTVVPERFRSTRAIEAIEQHQVTVLGCVSTQFLMILNDPTLDDHDLSSLRVMFTGGEAVPTHRAMEFEDRTGCTVLQFYGSNETGLLSGTTTRDPAWVRFETAGRIVDDMQVRLYDDDGLVEVEGVGRPACKGPATCQGYLEEGANAGLYTADGWMLMGDICSIDADGYLRVTGRTSDIIIRGGKNISAGQVENEVSTHPAIAIAAAVAMPDEVFGERVCVFVEIHEGADPLTLDDLKAHLLERKTSKELIPEALAVLEQLPRSSGAKIAKSELAALARERSGAAAADAKMG